MNDEFGSRILMVGTSAHKEIVECRGLRELIVLGKQRTSSMILNWGEDTEAWEVEIISGGKRFSTCRPMLWDALAEALTASRSYYVAEKQARSQANKSAERTEDDGA